MDTIVHTLAEQYAAQFSEQEDALLQKVHAYTVQQHPQAHMLSGQVQGAFLALLSRLIQPRRILEVGTFTGYSALCLAKGLAPDGELHTLEIRDADAAIARDFFNQSAYRHQIKLHIGAAKELIPNLSEMWDIVFIDADKTGYIEYYELILPFVRPAGLIIADNVLFHGEVLKQPLSGKNAKAIDAFNRHVLQDERVEQVMLTVRDGLLLVQKK
ncbi:MAG TPA: O-methyltransferase [Ferruginibacter sp.]|nr:O-methyltransferase [Ferruginibacter sp.]HMP20900.1 O-methyltransferase [Ferruginibacter sp.]